MDYLQSDTCLQQELGVSLMLESGIAGESCTVWCGIKGNATAAAEREEGASCKSAGRNDRQVIIVF